MHNHSDTTGSESTPISKDAPAIPTPVITPVDPPAEAAPKESGEAAQEEASLSLQPPTEQVAVCFNCIAFFLENIMMEVLSNEARNIRCLTIYLTVSRAR